MQCQRVCILENFGMVGHLIGKLISENHCDFEVVVGVEGLRGSGLRVKLSLEIFPIEDGGSGRDIDGEAEYDEDQSAEDACNCGSRASQHAPD